MKTKFILAKYGPVEEWVGREAGVGFWEPTKDGHCQRNKIPSSNRGQDLAAS